MNRQTSKPPTNSRVGGFPVFLLVFMAHYSAHFADQGLRTILAGFFFFPSFFCVRDSLTAGRQ
jgi:hypothetical protein